MHDLEGICDNAGFLMHISQINQEHLTDPFKLPSFLRMHHYPSSKCTCVRLCVLFEGKVATTAASWFHNSMGNLAYFRFLVIQISYFDFIQVQNACMCCKSQRGSQRQLRLHDFNDAAATHLAPAENTTVRTARFWVEAVFVFLNFKQRPYLHRI